jgi:hypothetical protein
MAVMWKLNGANVACRKQAAGRRSRFAGKIQ